VKRKRRKKLMRVKAKQGKFGRVISRLRNGKPILFSDADPLSAEIEVDDVVEGYLVHETGTYAIMRPVSVIKPNGVVYGA